MEGLIGVSIIALTVIGSLTTFSLYIKAGTKNLANVQSSYLLNEGVEALFYMRDLGWASNIGNKALTPTRHYFVWNGTTWTTSTTHIFVDAKYDRYFILESVCRDGVDNIVACGSATIDPGTLKATVYVDWWSNNATTSKSTTVYLFDLLSN